MRMFVGLQLIDILPPPNATALWRGIPGLPPGRFSVLRKRLLPCSPMGLPAPSVLFASRHFDPGGSPTRISSNDRSKPTAMDGVFFSGFDNFATRGNALLRSWRRRCYAAPERY